MTAATGPMAPAGGSGEPSPRASTVLLVRRFPAGYARNPVNLLMLALVPVAFVAAAAGSLAQLARLLSGTMAPGADMPAVTAGWAAAFIAAIAAYFQIRTARSADRRLVLAGCRPEGWPRPGRSPAWRSPRWPCWRRPPGPRTQDQRGVAAEGLAAEADSVVSFGESLWSPGTTGEVHEKVENSLRRDIAAYYQLGQLLAIPGLLEGPEITASPVNGTRLPLPGQPGFDPWCLTDPASRSVWQQDPAARRAIDMLWRYDPDPAATLGIQAQIDAAAAAGSIVLGATIGNAASHYFCCPWAAIYTVRRPVITAGQRMRSMQQFTFDVSAEEMAEGGEFVRRLLPGPFHPTDEVDYCDPTADE